ncbi:conserved Plasmodium protein, unknown function [Plasmodium chabaudi chabaudi]|uniref:Uncharacterized protein n=1 Tax=Plasmodium chabaudi chabaudi TaxID=31271 RepID=A0A077TJH2_PLACU|nr:conserved Plasmodium protein, unknown function [Plasmodium chabaudi chabaudi]SCM00546.1 conserved Plasmodium protein, unknown function [Plasmodium chabaudi chabaudi]SCM01952.1 conserved Plasmodium protein, unknown function [Plasmodium chabaudi chabaudi]VTZ68001.1 conserved Plasmodium protein, unknown function [Plasmodium chabaudi chabaudi]|eukprot:XP_016653586.1 conserved Plasmodium protein, unknown function [Plasmodium chabaudi chabaudi]
MKRIKESLHDENIQDVFISYNEIVQNNESETSVESYKDVNDFLENSDESSSSSSSENEHSDSCNSQPIDEKNNLSSFGSNNFKSKNEKKEKKEKKLKKSHTVSYIEHMSSSEKIPFKNCRTISYDLDRNKVLEDFHWKPAGKNVPDISSINLSRKKAWDIGKEGCNGILIKNIFESYKQKKLNYMVLDGTNIETFLTVYSHSYQETIKGINPTVVKIFSFYDLASAYYLYDVKQIHIFKNPKDKQTNKAMILKGLNDNFYNSILICLDETIRYLKYSNIKNSMLKKLDQKVKRKSTKDDIKFDKKTYFVKSAQNEKNIYNDNIKDVISFNKKKKMINSDAYLSDNKKGKSNKNFSSNSNPASDTDIDYNKKKSNTFLENMSSNNNEEYDHAYLNYIMKKEERELNKGGKMNNSNPEYSSHTSDSNAP